MAEAATPVDALQDVPVRWTLNLFKAAGKRDDLSMEINTATRNLLYVSVFVEANGQNGESWSGTAFLYDGNKTGNGGAPLLISNRHVFEGARELVFHFIKSEGGKPQVGDRVSIQIPNAQSMVFFHPDPNIDLAVITAAPILTQLRNQGDEVFFRMLSNSLIPDDDTIRSLDVVEDVLFVGYPQGLFDQVNFTPIFGRGVTATPIQYDYNGLPVFVVDASVFPGSSGSPVLIVNTGSYMQNGGMILGQSRVLFLGVIAAVHVSTQSGVLVPTAMPSVSVDVPMGLGLVFRSSSVEEMIDALFAASGAAR